MGGGPCTRKSGGMFLQKTNVQIKSYMYPSGYSSSWSRPQSGGGGERGRGEEHSVGGFNPRWAGQWQRLRSPEALQTQTWNGERQDQQRGQRYPGLWPGGTGGLLLLMSDSGWSQQEQKDTRDGTHPFKGIFRCKFNPWSNTQWNCVRLPLERSS